MQGGKRVEYNEIIFFNEQCIKLLFTIGHPIKFVRSHNGGILEIGTSTIVVSKEGITKNRK